MTRPQATSFVLNGQPNRNPLNVGFFSGLSNDITIKGTDFDLPSVDDILCSVTSADVRCYGFILDSVEATEIKGRFFAQGFPWPGRTYVLFVNVSYLSNQLNQIAPMP